MEVSLSDVAVVRCGCDFLTTTWPSEIRDTILQSTKNVMDWARENATLNGSGNWVRKWAWQGYDGFRCGPVACGERPDGSILKLEGIAAHAWLDAGLSAGHNISRIDIAATVWGVSEQSELIGRHKVSADTHRKTLQHKPYRVRLIDGVGDGDTLYCGSRESVYFLRVYDKERAPNSTPEYKGSIRYEAECKEELAQQVYAGIVSGGYSVANCSAILGGLLARRGIDPVYIGCLQSKNLPPVAVPASDIQRSLRWLNLQVKPTLINLLKMGYEQEALQALGLDKFWRDYSETT